MHKKEFNIKPKQPIVLGIDFSLSKVIVVLFMVFAILILPIGIYEKLSPKDNVDEIEGRVAGTYTQRFYENRIEGNRKKGLDPYIILMWGGGITIILSLLTMLIYISSTNLYKKEKYKL